MKEAGKQGSSEQRSNGRMLMLSIRPAHSEKILRGEKTVELRRLRPDVRQGDTLFVYASAPVSAVVGTAKVTGVKCHHPSHLWKLVRSACALTYGEFKQYFDGADCGYAISLSTARRAERPLSLRQIQAVCPAFRAPQGYRYLDGTRPPDRLITAALKTSSLS
jgi:predicted transcriptional regulator